MAQDRENVVYCFIFSFFTQEIARFVKSAFVSLSVIFILKT